MEQWNNLLALSGFASRADATRGFISARSAPAWGQLRPFQYWLTGKHLFDRGKLLARLGRQSAGLLPDQFISPHGLAVDSRADIHVGEVSFTERCNRRYQDQPLPPEIRSLQKLIEVD